MTAVPWDEELERLAIYVRQHFGDDALEGAGRRAITRLTPLDASDAADHADHIIKAADGHLYDVDLFWNAVRRELQRLIAPH